MRFCREIPKTGELGVFRRGDESVLELFPGAELDNPYSMNVADICPVGALTTRDFRFKIRVWFLQDVPGVCTGCARGCNVDLGVANNKVVITSYSIHYTKLYDAACQGVSGVESHDSQKDLPGLVQLVEVLVHESQVAKYFQIVFVLFQHVPESYLRFLKPAEVK